MSVAEVCHSVSVKIYAFRKHASKAAEKPSGKQTNAGK